jgi:ERCC4-type nuclease
MIDFQLKILPMLKLQELELCEYSDVYTIKGMENIPSLDFSMLSSLTSLNDIGKIKNFNLFYCPSVHDVTSLSEIEMFVSNAATVW